MYLETFGGAKLKPGDLMRPKPLLLLAYLTLEGVKERRHLCELFYRDTRDPRAGLRVGLRHIRKHAARAVTTRGSMVGAAVSADVLDFLAALERQDDREAIGLYRGPFLEGIAIEGWSAELEEWVLGTREYLASSARQAMLRGAEALAAAGDVGAAAIHAERAYLLPAAPPADPEELRVAHRLLAVANHPRATRVRQDLEDLGVALPRTTEPTIPLAPEPSDGEGGATVPNNLPPPTTSFVGRQQQLDEVTRSLRDPHRRLVTVLGPGGIGKTRLALEVARRQREGGHWDGVYAIELDAVTDPAVIPTHIARALSYRLRHDAEPLDELLDLVGRKRLLLVLDNFEAFVGTSDIVPALLRRCPAVSLIVTSRTRLNLAAESVYPLEGLPLPAADDSEVIAEEPRGRRGTSVQLFVDRALSADLRSRPTPESAAAILEICRLVEGAPLGIELAAAWVRAMPIPDIARRLRADLDSLASRQADVPVRHRSLRAAFESSWRLLDDRERTAFAGLSVFRGGFRREDAAYVTGASIPVLASLVDKSLLRVSPTGRYDRHALLHQYSVEKLAEEPSEGREVEERHVERFSRLAEEAESELWSTAQARWLERLDEETDNFRAALAWTLREGRTDLGLRLAGSLGVYWSLRAAVDEGRRWLDELLSQPGSSAAPAYAKALLAAGRLARIRGDFERAEALIGESLALSERLEDTRRIATCVNQLGIIAAAQAEYDDAIEHFERARLLASELDSDEGLGSILGNLGLLYTIVGRVQEAQSFHERSLDLRRAHGDLQGTASTLNNMALAAIQRHEFDRALELYDESIRIAEDIRDRFVAAGAFLGKGTAHHWAGDPAAAIPHVKRSLDLYLALNDRLGVVDAVRETASLAVTREEPLLAVRLWDALDVVRAELNYPMRPFERDRHEEDLQRVHELLEGDAPANRPLAGKAWSLDDAAARALAWLSPDATRPGFARETR